jgi:hypothetical protein
LQSDKVLFKALGLALSFSGETVEEKGFTDLRFRVTFPPASVICEKVRIILAKNVVGSV